MKKSGKEFKEGLIKTVLRRDDPEYINENDSFNERLKQPLSYKYDWTLSKVQEYCSKKGLKPEETKILDVGCGTGMMIHLLDKSGYKVQGVDSDNNSINVVNTHSPNVQLYNNNILDCKLSHSYYHIIICLQVIEHISKDKEALVRMLSWLRKDGLLILTTPIGTNLMCSEHVNFYNYYDIVDMFKEQGSNFRVCRINKFKKYNYKPNIWGVTYFKEDDKDG